MAIDVYSMPVEERTYVKHNIFKDPTIQKADGAIGVNIYQNFLYTQIDSKGYIGMTTAASVVLNHWVDFGVFCSYYFPETQPIFTYNSTKSTMFLNTYLFCGNTVGFMVLPDAVVHPKFVLDVGVGHASNAYIDSKNQVQSSTNPILVLRPSVLMDMNVYSFVEWTLGLGYRFQLSFFGPGGSATYNTKASWLEISTGVVFNVR